MNKTLINLRIEAGMTQEQLAKACGWSGNSTISQFENDMIEMRQRSANKIFKALEKRLKRTIFHQEKLSIIMSKK